ncbi:MAG: trypsin-like peptidase domain-containing protein [Acidimicrobiales bacterium]
MRAPRLVGMGVAAWAVGSMALTPPAARAATARTARATYAARPTPRAPSPPRWAPAGKATIHPGSSTLTEGSQCTSNFVFYDRTSVYLGQAGHCSSTDGDLVTDGCSAHLLPIGTKVSVRGAKRPGVLVYDSWTTMQQVHEANANTCASNDLALIRIDPADAGSVNPSIPHWGGPTGPGGATPPGQTVYSFGNSELRLGIFALSPKKGSSLGDEGCDRTGCWDHANALIAPAIPGDSGSPLLDDHGRAVGVLSTGETAPRPTVSHFGDLSRELAYVSAHTRLRVTLAVGTERFDGSLPPIG